VKRIYADGSKYLSPYNSPRLTLTGLGTEWPAGRHYYDVAHFRAPYRLPYFQDGTLMGLGDLSLTDIVGTKAAAELENARAREAERAALVERMATAKAQESLYLYGAAALGLAVAAFFAGRALRGRS
jgi:hypothetical protein